MMSRLTSVCESLPDTDSTENGLDRESVRLWWIDLDWPEANLAAGSQILSDAENDRVKRFHRHDHAKRFIAAHAAVRMIVGQCLDVAPKELMFSTNRYGKPFLVDERQTRQLEFNLAHSAGFGVCAVTIGRPVGVDLEQIRLEVSCLEIARRFFSPNETRHLSTLTGDVLIRAFYRLWTGKEAYAKAIGRGLSMPFDKFELPVSPQNARWLIPSSPISGESWALFDISPNKGYTAAVVVSASEELPLRIVQSKFDPAQVR